MNHEHVNLPSSVEIRQHVVTSLREYWPNSRHLVLALPVQERSVVTTQIPLELVEVSLPEWAIDLGVLGKLLVPSETVDSSRNWESVDWWLAAFLLLEGWHERAWEARYGSIHSYSYRLQEWDSRAWDHAWVNRIGLLLRRWSARLCDLEDNALHGKRPEPQFFMTHDVDAIRKTKRSRVKQGAFWMYNYLKSHVKTEKIGNLVQHGRSLTLRSIIDLVFGPDDWFQLPRLVASEISKEIEIIYFVHAGAASRNPLTWILNPAYQLDSQRAKEMFDLLEEAGAQLGLHPSVQSWKSVGELLTERQALEQASQRAVRYVRQHWLKFSWDTTWKCQKESGLQHDMTLMFNDRAGFRNSAALTWSPLCLTRGQSHGILATPTVVMDSHLFDYEQHDQESRHQRVSSIVQECKFVGGSAALLWHPHTLSDDFGWSATYEHMLREITQ